MFARQLQQREREVIYQTKGRGHGAITRLMSPSDLGELVKPFVFLDHAIFDGETEPMPMEYFWHPHSGIATVTVMLEGGIQYAETTGKQGVVPAGGVEWMRAGNGVWHTGQPEPGEARAFQLWVALPPELENGPNASHYVMPKDVPVEGPVRVILGSYGKVKSSVDAPPMNYFVVSLKGGEHWTYQPPKGHTVLWVAVDQGKLETATASVVGGEMAIFEPSEDAIEFVAERNTTFVIGSAVKHPHDLVLGNYSVHTSLEALLQGEAEIRRIGQKLRADGILRR